MSSNQIYLIIHTHEYGTSVHRIRWMSAREPHFEVLVHAGCGVITDDEDECPLVSPDLKLVLDRLEIDYEPWKDEVLEHTFEGPVTTIFA